MLVTVRQASGFFSGLGAAVFFWFIHQATSVVSFGIALVLLLGYISCLNIFLFRPVNVAEHTSLQLVSAVSFVLLVSILEWPVAKQLVTALVGLVFWGLFLSGAVAPGVLPYGQKPARRFIVSVVVFDVFALMAGGFALTLFFPQIFFWFIALIGGTVYAVASLFIWQLYIACRWRDGLLWLLLVLLVMTEVLWVFHLLPFGYLVLAVLVTWLWYIIQLLVRFHVSPQGIRWVKQRWFLFTNAVLFVIVLTQFVRWV